MTLFSRLQRSFKRNFRGAGWIFGADVAKEFNQVNGLELVCRAHQMAMDGYQYFFDKEVCTVIASHPSHVGMVRPQLLLSIWKPGVHSPA